MLFLYDQNETDSPNNLSILQEQTKTDSFYKFWMYYNSLEYTE